MAIIKHALSVRSDFSIGESTIKVGDLVDRAVELGYESVALVDTMTISSMVSFANKAKKAGIKPIIGCTLRVYDNPRYRKPKKASGEEEIPNPSYQLKVYVHDDVGLRSLFKLLSKANSEEYFYYHSRVGLDDVLELENVTVTTGDLFNVFHHPEAWKILLKLDEKFPTYAEIVPINTPLFDKLNAKAIDEALRCGLPLVASYPAFYLNDEGADSLDVLRAISTNTKMSAPWLPIPYVRNYSLGNPDDLVRQLYSFFERVNPAGKKGYIHSALKGIEEIAASCTYEFKKLSPCLPKMAENEFSQLMMEIKKGWAERFSAPVFGHKPSEEDLPIYKERLAYELGVLRNMGFSGYFLLVQDIVQWSKNNGIMVGPGRGSVGGSLVAYLLGITDSDPIRFKLMFERFINPSRIDLPDADLDFMSSRRHEVIEYIINKYGADKVAGVSNYSTLGPASAIRDTSRMFDLHPFEYACSKQVDKEHGVSTSLTVSAEKVPDIGKFSETHPTIWNHALNLEGVMRGLGQHAAGIVVADEPLINRAVVETRSGGAVVNWDKSTVEEFGLIKMDILGLSTLDILKKAAEYIQERHHRKINLLRLPLDDAKVMAAFGRGDTVGIFQFESPGMQKILKDLALNEPLTFEDITATTAIYRPGPIDAGFVDQYIGVKQGNREPYYEHPTMEESLASTYGVMVYQEQIMQICQDLAGFTLTEADNVRKAMGKKDHDKMAEWRSRFVEGAIKADMTEMAATMLWEKIAGFASYAFNRSHATTYSMLSYMSMWLKVNYTAEFFAAAMTVIDKEEKLSSFVNDARKFGLKILPPDINKSSDRIEIDGEDTLYMPFQAIKGISTNVAAKILEVRRSMKLNSFHSKTEFEAYAKAKVGGKINKSHKDKMDKVGAFASIEPGTRPATHPDRLRDRLELLPGFTTESVKADRGISNERENLLAIIRVANDIRSCDLCPLKGEAHPSPRIGKSPKFMMVFDSPSWEEAKAGKMLEGDIAGYLKAALKDAGLSANDGYFTSLVKSPKAKGEKTLSNDSINACSTYLKREIELLKPPIIVAMGSNSIRYFAPGLKGPGSDLLGKVIFDPKLDASIVFGLNPAQIVYDPSKVKILQTVCEKIAELIT
jgi:DNA polymerase-3 subunit alpha